jgi:4'-phosphopantetheinyl transferase
LYRIDRINEYTTIGLLDLPAFAEGTTPHRRSLEKEAIQFLLKQLFHPKVVRLEYTATNKPFLAGENLHISISHSHDKLAIIVNLNQRTGIDVELIRDKVLNVQHKFLCPEELEFAASDVLKLTVLWAAKESIYKAYGLKEVDLKKDIRIEPFDLAHNNFFGHIRLPHFNKKYLLSQQQLDGYILVFILNEV